MSEATDPFAATQPDRLKSHVRPESPGYPNSSEHPNSPEHLEAHNPETQHLQPQHPEVQYLEPQHLEPQRTASPLASLLARRTARRLRARRVRRLVRHIEPWSVFKMSLIFYLCLWAILLIAGVILWRFAVTAGTVNNVETFIKELLALETFTFNSEQIFRVSAIGGLVMVVGGSGFTVLMAVLFNLISDLVGGVRMTVVEEETARPRPKRLQPTRSRPNQTAPHQAMPEPVNDPPFWPSEKRKSRKQRSVSK